MIALGLAMALPMSIAILATSFAPERRGRVLGLFASAIAVGRMTAARLEDYGVLAAMLSSFGTAAGTIGMTITVALMEGAGGSRLWTDDSVFASAQQFAFACLVPVGLLAVAAALQSRHSPTTKDNF